MGQQRAKAGGEPIRVVVVDDQELFRRGLTMLLNVEEDIEVVGEASDGVAAADLAASSVPDVVLMDVRMPKQSGIEACSSIKDVAPNARIIMDHLPSFDPTPDNQKAYEDVVQEMAKRPNIFVKLTEVYHPRLIDGSVVDDYTFLANRLEYLYHLFGEDRVMFGTDYPNSYGVATISEEVGLMKKFFSKKTKAQAEKYFWRNAAHIYKYVKRTPDQPSL